jgi:hypothetical protein
MPHKKLAASGKVMEAVCYCDILLSVINPHDVSGQPTNAEKAWKFPPQLKSQDYDDFLGPEELQIKPVTLDV